ncbi:MAG: GTPase of the mitochondrial inner membrane that associates with the large ribosomal subunit [Alyxoria varia]|nr:MAG: GTPase of the mitochondrial inner membrane that associates with the large ribosomal subunit [Alyxoria varia]
MSLFTGGVTPRQRSLTRTSVPERAAPAATISEPTSSPSPDSFRYSGSHVNPAPEDYSLNLFVDRCTVTLQSGPGGNGCVSFLREKFVEEGPANGGDGGDGGSVYIQAIKGETSLHKIARKGMIRAERGGHGQGKGKGGERGNDIILDVPVGTVIREIERHDPQEDQRGLPLKDKSEASSSTPHDNWIVYPGLSPTEVKHLEAPKDAKTRMSIAQAAQPQSPIRLDLEEPTQRPTLLAAGAVGGLGNPHFVTKDKMRPKFATKGRPGMKMLLELELKMLADVGLVGLPNAGKSTLLRAISNSRTRVGDWEFTTLQPSIGTVVIDDYKGRPAFRGFEKNGEPRPSFTVADIPGLIEDAHLDKGLGLGFLRHVERASVLAFLIDLSAGDAITALKALWREVSEYETLRHREINAETERRVAHRAEIGCQPRPTIAPPISSKPWFVVATKADLDGTQSNFAALRTYMELLAEGQVDHPSGRKNAWKRLVKAIPVSASNREGLSKVTRLVLRLLEE